MRVTISSKVLSQPTEMKLRSRTPERCAKGYGTAVSDTTSANWTYCYRHAVKSAGIMTGARGEAYSYQNHLRRSSALSSSSLTPS